MQAAVDPPRGTVAREAGAGHSARPERRDRRGLRETREPTGRPRGQAGLRGAQGRSPDHAWRLEERARPGGLVAAPGAARQAGPARALSRPPDLPKARGIDETGPTRPADLSASPRRFHRQGPGDGARRFPPFLATGESAAQARPRASARSSGRRSALADWLVRPDHPLTARVIVNRLWQHHFGRGLVATASDFGTMGDEPSHPELLDWLATELIARGWSLKAMHRLIVTSATYRQSSVADREVVAADPDNLLFSRQNRQRLDGEAIRDALLSVSGSLNPAMKGPSVFPELPAELSKLSSKGAVWPVSPRLADRRRRSLYVFVRRNLRYPFFEVFDRPDTNASCPRRPVTTIAPQALSLLNSTLAREAAADARGPRRGARG